MSKNNDANKLDPRLFKKLGESKKINKSPKAIRTAIWRIRNKNKGLTLNAAASLLADQYKISVSRYLSAEDRASISSANVKVLSAIKQAPIKKSKIKSNVPPYGNQYWDGAFKNAEIYPYIFVLENSLRNLILDKFKDEKDWWSNKSFVSKKIQEYAENIKEAEKRHPWLGPGRSEEPIYYINLEHLFKIIEKNFNPRFKGIFDLQDLRTWIKECVPIRNLVAHNIKTKKEDRDNIKIRTKYICTLIEKAK